MELLCAHYTVHFPVVGIMEDMVDHEQCMYLCIPECSNVSVLRCCVALSMHSNVDLWWLWCSAIK